MDAMLSTPWRATIVGLALSALVLLAWIASWGGEAIAIYWPGVLAVLLRFLHVLAGIIWVGFIWYVNFVQLLAVAELDEAGRAVIHEAVAPRAAFWFRHASTVTVVSGLGMLLFTSYLTLGGIATPRGILIGIAMLLGVVMWGIVHMTIWPAMRIVLAGTGTKDEVRRARDSVRRFARVNLVLALPVTFAMVGAAHLF